MEVTHLPFSLSAGVTVTNAIMPSFLFTLFMGMQTRDLMIVEQAAPYNRCAASTLPIAVQQAPYPLLYLPRHYLNTQATITAKMKQSNMIRGLHTIVLSLGQDIVLLFPYGSLP